MSARLDTLLTMLAADPQDSFIHYALAKEYESLGNYDMALKTFLALKENDPSYVGLYYHLGKLYEVLERPMDALIVYDQGITCGKKQSDFHAISELSNAKTNLEMEL